MLAAVRVRRRNGCSTTQLFESESQLHARAGQDPLQRRDARLALAALDAGDLGLGHAGALGQLPLRETGLKPRQLKERTCGRRWRRLTLAHPCMMADRLSTRHQEASILDRVEELLTAPPPRLAARPSPPRGVRIPERAPVPSHSPIHRGDSAHLVRTDLEGGTGVDESLASHPGVFVSLTVPGVRRGPYRLRLSERSVTKRHPADPRDSAKDSHLE